MRNRTLSLLIVLCFICSTRYVYAQNSSTGKSVKILLTADSLASGNYKDILTSFYQLAAKDLTGANKEVHFTSNPFAIMLRNDPTLAKSNHYTTHINRLLRRFNFDIDARLDSVYHFNGFSLGLNYAIINKRDVSLSDTFSQLALNDQNDQQYASLLKIVSSQILIDYPRASPLRDTLLKEQNRAATDSLFTYGKMSLPFRRLVKKVAADHDLLYVIDQLNRDSLHTCFAVESKKGFHELMREFQNKPLWTIGISDTSYKTGLLSKSLVVSSEFLRGFINPSKNFNLELDIKTSLGFVDDTLVVAKNLRRQVFNIEPGINFVLKGKKSGNSYLEFKTSGSYNNIWRGYYTGEQQTSITINGTLRIKIIDDLWIPILIKYDPKKHNLFGFLNVTANFSGLNSLVKSIK